MPPEPSDLKWPAERIEEHSLFMRVVRRSMHETALLCRKLIKELSEIWREADRLIKRQ